ncbi:hypothetical protein JCM17823_06390 [Halorubrum gandharaense]
MPSEQPTPVRNVAERLAERGAELAGERLQVTLGNDRTHTVTVDDVTHEPMGETDTALLEVAVTFEALPDVGLPAHQHGTMQGEITVVESDSAGWGMPALLQLVETDAGDEEYATVGAVASVASAEEVTA